MCPFYNAQLFEITGAAKGVFTRSQSSCHIAKVVLTIRHDSRQIPIASDARPFHISRGFLHWRFAYAGPTVRAALPSWGRHPQTFTEAVIPKATRQHFIRGSGKTAIDLSVQSWRPQPRPRVPFGGRGWLPNCRWIRVRRGVREALLHWFRRTPPSRSYIPA